MKPSEFFARMTLLNYTDKQIDELHELAHRRSREGIYSLAFYLQDAFDMVRESGYDYAKDMLTPKEK